MDNLTKQRFVTYAIFPVFLLTAAWNGDTRQAQQEKPPHVFVDVGVCPFECCTYRQWTVVKKTAILDRPSGKKILETVSKGTVVTGLSGEVISEPIPVKTDRDIPGTPIKNGDTFYVLHYDGEGYWKVWFDGKIAYVHESVIDVPHPKADWWVKIKDAHGRIGWALSSDNFAHQDACE
ncbi:MAG: hypothetical protein ACYDDI_00175 [Candidatus Acidiferrales bacterium]